MDDHELRRLTGGEWTGGWGASSPAMLPDGSPVFVKRLPLTDLEHRHGHSTRNLFRLPLIYQYGVGSAGFGVWRELATHAKTTGWVLDGSWPGFPLLLHHRVLPRLPARVPNTPSSTWIESPDYVRYWNSSKRIGAFLEARRTSPFELWLVLEHVPDRLFDWLRDHQDAAGAIAEHLTATVRFLHDHGVFHFDAHEGNVVVDGAAPLLTDFGLANDRRFALSPDEHAFLDRHQHYDFGEALYGVGDVLHGMLAAVGADEGQRVLRELGAVEPHDPEAVVGLLVASVEALAAERALGVTRTYADVVVRYRRVILFMNDFFSAMRTNPKKNSFFDDAQLAGLLADAGVDTG